jgi:hypothetical protein
MAREIEIGLLFGARVALRVVRAAHTSRLEGESRGLHRLTARAEDVPDLQPEAAGSRLSESRVVGEHPSVSTIASPIDVSASRLRNPDLAQLGWLRYATGSTGLP